MRQPRPKRVSKSGTERRTNGHNASCPPRFSRRFSLGSWRSCSWDLDDYPRIFPLTGLGCPSYKERRPSALRRTLPQDPKVFCEPLNDTYYIHPSYPLTPGKRMNFKLVLAALLTASATSVLAAPAPVAEPAPNPIAAPAPQVTCSGQGQRCSSTLQNHVKRVAFSFDFDGRLCY